MVSVSFVWLTCFFCFCAYSLKITIPTISGSSRHSYATVLLTAGMSPVYVQKQLRNSSISITVDVYGHLIPNEGGAGLEDALTGAGKFVPNPVRKMHIFTYSIK